MIKTMELQLFLVWNNAVGYLEHIIQELSSVFQIRAVFESIWDRMTTLQKMKEIYQFSSTEAEMKIAECGYGKVVIIIVEDKNPITKLYPTKYGTISVNKHAQEIKEKIRNIYRNNIIHGTMLDFEFESDIQICISKTKEAFTKEYFEKWTGEICII